MGDRPLHPDLPLEALPVEERGRAARALEVSALGAIAIGVEDQPTRHRVEAAADDHPDRRLALRSSTVASAMAVAVRTGAVASSIQRAASGSGSAGRSRRERLAH